ncbi:MAG TPA: hypothetical protein VIW26_11940 [Gemmatimonadales bacterium]|jgi:hypothetical protein
MLSAVLLLAAAQPDSEAALRSVQLAQQAFEARRGFLAPRTLGSSHGGVCDEKIGRFCYWYDGDAPPPPPEPEAIKRARLHLLELLDSAAARLPGDWWIAGQRVRYLVESDRLADAVAAARACRAEQWWCEALEGFARHAAGEDAAADSVYAAAVADMPAPQRCRWTDLTPLLDGGLRRRYSRLDCASRASFSDHLWWLAQPLLSRPGNDRRVEHYARLTMVRMLERAGSPWASPLADDLRELTLRYGWPVAWTGPLDSDFDARDVSGHERQPAFHFFPGTDAESEPGSSPWDISPPHAHERYAPLYATTFETLTPDITVFRRGESTLVVVAYDLSRDTLWGQPPDLSRVVVLARDEHLPPVLTRTEDSNRKGVMVAQAPWPATVVGFEVTQPGTLRFGRARLALAQRNLGASGLLVFDPVDSVPGDLSAVLSLVHGSATIAAGGRIGLYWEVYLTPGESVETQVNVSPRHAGLLRSMGSWFGLGRRSREMRLAWHDVADPETGMIHRAVIVDVSSLVPGRYRISVTIAARGGNVTTARELEIVRP